MTEASIFHLEPFPRFLHRVVELNRLHNPEDPVHGAVLAEAPVDGAGKDDALLADGAGARRLLATLHRDFPFGAPVHEQAAFLVRGFAGLAPFAEANHRTGWDYLAELLEHQGYRLLATSEDGRALASELWQRMESTYPAGLQRRQVLDRDPVFLFLADWFRPRIA